MPKRKLYALIGYPNPNLKMKMQAKTEELRNRGLISSESELICKACAYYLEKIESKEVVLPRK